MAQEIRIAKLLTRTGLKSSLPQPLSPGELGTALDTGEVFIGLNPANTAANNALPILRCYNEIDYNLYSNQLISTYLFQITLTNPAITNTDIELANDDNVAAGFSRMYIKVDTRLYISYEYKYTGMTLDIPGLPNTGLGTEELLSIATGTSFVSNSFNLSLVGTYTYQDTSAIGTLMNYAFKSGSGVKPGIVNVVQNLKIITETDTVNLLTGVNAEIDALDLRVDALELEVIDLDDRVSAIEATPDVLIPTTGRTDGTATRVLRLADTGSPSGDYRFDGPDTDVVDAITSWDNITGLGVYKDVLAGNNTAGPGGTAGYIAQNIQINTTTLIQFAHPITATTGLSSYSRIQNSGVWGNWRQILDSDLKQSSLGDTTTDKLLTVGSFALGGNSLTLPIDDLDTPLVTGWYQVQSTTANSPAGTTDNSTVLHMQTSTGNAYQLLFSGNDLYSRSQLSTVWGTWSNINGSASDITVLNSNSTTEVNKSYYITGNYTITLPSVTGLVVGNRVTFTKSLSATPIIQREGTTENIITENGTDISILYNLNSEIIIIFNGTDWEV